MADSCQNCEGTGWRRVERDGVLSVEPCPCRRKKPDNQPLSPKFQRVGPALDHLVDRLGDAALMPLDRRLAAILKNHRGRANAISSAELAGLVFDGVGDPKRSEEFRRGITKSIERLRTFARLPIAATKEPPYGYFLAATDAECDEMHERYVRELIRCAALARLFRPQADLVQRLRGQLELQGAGKQGLGIRDSGLAEQKPSAPNPQSLTPNPCSPPEAR